jgi:hypothetical protein
METTVLLWVVGSLVAVFVFGGLLARVLGFAVSYLPFLIGAPLIYLGMTVPSDYTWISLFIGVCLVIYGFVSWDTGGPSR